MYNVSLHIIATHSSRLGHARVPQNDAENVKHFGFTEDDSEKVKKVLLFCGGLKVYPTCPQGLQGFPGLPYAVYMSGLQSAVGLEEIRLGKKNKEGRRKMWLPAKKQGREQVHFI